MAKILLRGLTSFIGVSFVPGEFMELEHETAHRANQRESRGDLGKIWVYRVPMVYPNTTEKKGPSVYPLSTPAMGTGWGG